MNSMKNLSRVIKNTKKLTKKERDFIEYIIKDCEKKNVKVHLGLGRFVTDNEDRSWRCNGYFQDDPAVLAVATGQAKDKWIRILAHEHSHLDQWHEKAKVWTDCYVGGRDVGGIFHEWVLGNVELRQPTVWKYASRLRDLELDCDRRAIIKIKKFGLNIDTEKYIQKAHAYALYYNILTETRKYYKIGKESYNLPSVWKKMPKDFRSKKILREPPTPELIKIFDACYVK